MRLITILSWVSLALVVGFGSGCTSYVSTSQVKARMANTPNPHGLSIYFSPETSPAHYEVMGYLEWRKLSFLAHRKKMGHRFLKKANKLIKKGKISRDVNGLIIDDYLHGTLIRTQGEKPTSYQPANSASPRPKARTKKPREKVPPRFAPDNRLRLGASLGRFRREGNGHWNLMLRAGLPINEKLELGTQAGRFFRSGESGRFSQWALQMNVRVLLALRESMAGVPDIIFYPIAGLNLGLQSFRTRYVTSEESWEVTRSLRPGMNVGFGFEYRMTADLSLQMEVLTQLQRDSNALGLSLGVMRYL